MEHIKRALNRIKQHGSRATFYRTNRDIFQRYFRGHQHYDGLIDAGNFDRIDEIIKENTKFNK